MREDMGKVVIERPRRSSTITYKDIRHNKISQEFNKIQIRDLVDQENQITDEEEIMLETMPKGGIEKMKKVYGWERKELTDLLGPIKRFLQSQIGNNWDDVWSQVCKTLKGKYSVEHVRDHVKNMVIFDKEYEEHKWFRFYVDSHNILRGIKPISRHTKVKYLLVDGYYFKKKEDDKFWELDANFYYRQQKSANNSIKLFIDNKNREYVLLDGIWYSFTYKDVNDIKFIPNELSKTDLLRSLKLYTHYMITGEKISLTEKNFSRQSNEKLSSYKRIRTSKCQLSHKELKQLNLIDEHLAIEKEIISFKNK